MSLTEDATDVALALGKGVYSVGQDLAYGLDRTGEGLGLGNSGRISEIGYENRAMYNLMKEFVSFGIENKKSPLFKSIVTILEHYYVYMSEDTVYQLAKQAGVAASYTTGRMVVGKSLAEAVTVRIAASIAASATYKILAKKLGVSSAFGVTGVGIPISMFMMQGVLQRSSLSATRLRMKAPLLHSKLKKNGNYQFLYFILEKPLSKYIEVIGKAENL